MICGSYVRDGTLMTSKSTSIVRFIANLSPLYQGEHVEDAWCARSLTDGTLILPIDELAQGAEREDGWVLVRWQGDSTRQTEVLGSQIATVALARYIELRGQGQPEKLIASELKRLSFHFTVKTGCYLELSDEDELSENLVSAIRAAVGRLGEKAVIAALLKAIGL